MRAILKQGVTTIPALGISLVPKFVCGACWPALGAAFAALGVGPLVSVPYLTPLTFLVLAVTAANLWRGADRDPAHRSFWIGLLAIGGVVTGKFWFESATVTYAAVGLLVLASVWQVVIVARAQPTCAVPHGCAVPTTQGERR